MGNRLFQEARKYVNLAKNGDTSGKQEALSRAKNAISSAYANSTVAEQRQLQELQNELDN
ncbi:DUF3813 domain-containing protein [Bacillus methanolicus]|uniref:DUF3813 domain-containing protein n=1 Tax=Bacillus methanolicus (strain MGA3 / ATCC 53907) TaxID=796606 RepID=I3E7M0_BACMM|nr:DUF3813 domain-containing protein [Bacillus methanolicus]AIE59316.1 hypothetical protein BMMGA3_04380 [Bacillus methanolicus MGA3]EIJ82491.1 hypothetical protein MGA3_04595 [Bacillus methanolicus MGA3]UQD51388.1 DUF3813 domain-containing protein [Bacillus methanolicus]